MNQICKIGNFRIANINSLFCLICKKLINQNSKICKNFKCNSALCNECFNKNKYAECPKCKNKKIKDFSIYSFPNTDELLFFCSKSIKCKNQYNIEEFLKKHSHENEQIMKCHNCNNNLYNTPNILECIKCKNLFYHKNLNYNPFSCKQIKHSENNCGKRCFKCFNPICNKCNKNKYKYIICSECNFKCEICSKKKGESICEICNKVLCESCIKLCKKCSTILCQNDFKNKSVCINHKLKDNNKCILCKLDKSSHFCSICNSNICISNCLIVCNNSSCKKIICINCCLFCNICKSLICKNCSIQCSNCTKEKSLISCIKCNSDAIINCSMKNCTTKLCLSCVKYCNYCEEINCESHSLTCENCSETICRFHWHICKKCSNENEEKLCLKNCLYKCYYCNNEVNALCKEENHINDFCKKFPCGHYVCNSCVKRCEDCKKIIQGCFECEIENKFIHCRICKKNLCYECGKQCSHCKEYYCNEKHSCYLCGIEIKNVICPNCDFISRSKCLVCSKGLTQCESCFKIIICSSKCFLIYVKRNNMRNNNSGFARSYTIQSNKSTSFKSSVTNNMINSVINLFQNNKDKENKNSTIYNNLKSKSVVESDKGKHLCFMYWCDEHLGVNMNEPLMIQSNNLNELIPKNSSDNIPRLKKINDQTNVKCSSCSIF